MRERNTTNINNELCAIDKQIKYFEKELEYYDSSRYGHDWIYPLSGLDEEDFYEIKNKIVEMLKHYYNKKADELIEFCKANKK